MKKRSFFNKAFSLILELAIFVISVLVINDVALSPVFAVELDGANDFIDGNVPGQRDVEHNIGFLIPNNVGHSIISTDYIIITFTNYSDITLPTASQGWTSGTPVYSRDGRRILITGVTASIGSGITVTGITTTYPSAGDSDFITIQVANNALGSIIYDQVVLSPTIFKESVTTSITVDQIISSLQFMGYTSPNAFVTIRLNGGVSGTTLADTNGFYDKRITGLTPDTMYTASIFAHDTRGLDSNSVSLNALTLPNMNFLISDIVIPTTISLNPNAIFEGDTMMISGMGHPNSQINLLIGASMEHAITLQVRTDGTWEYPYNSLNLPLNSGPHEVVAQEIVTGGYTSVFTDPLFFNLNSCRIADLNCDTHVNLTDFSILMYYWYRTNPSNERSDINRDSIVDETDFSLMMYYWTD